MRKLKIHGRSKSRRSQFIFPVIIFVFMLCLISVSVFFVLGELDIFHLSFNLNTAFVSIIVPVLGIIITLGQWLHTISSDKKKEIQGHSQKQIDTLSNLPVMPDPQISENVNIISNRTQVEEDLIDIGSAPHVEHFHGRVTELETITRWIGSSALCVLAYNP